jgi:DNA-directed RNA polymerase sigma subunit (sigma70/sigma32)
VAATILELYRTPEHAVEFQRWWKSLTKLQKNAVRAYILENREQQSIAKIAKRFGISADSLKDRLEQAYKKLRRMGLDDR